MSRPLTKKQTKDLKAKLAEKYQVPAKEIVFVLEDIDDAINVGSLFRTADACGAELVLTGRTPQPPEKQVSMVARGLERSVPWTYIADCGEAIDKLKAAGYEVIGVELAEESKLYTDINYSNKVAFLLGNEAIGIYKKYLAMCNQVVFIPMLGKGPSLNVNVAAAIVGFVALKE